MTNPVASTDWLPPHVPWNRLPCPLPWGAPVVEAGQCGNRGQVGIITPSLSSTNGRGVTWIPNQLCAWFQPLDHPPRDPDTGLMLTTITHGTSLLIQPLPHGMSHGMIPGLRVAEILLAEQFNEDPDTRFEYLTAVRLREVTLWRFGRRLFCPEHANGFANLRGDPVGERLPEHPALIPLPVPWTASVYEVAVAALLLSDVH